jgi:hypothetical protein
MTLRVDFTSQEYLRDPVAHPSSAAGIRRPDQISDHRQGLDHDDAGDGRQRPGPGRQGRMKLV